MPSAHHTFRRAYREDISRSRILWECSRKYFDLQTWRALPSLLEDLLRRELISLAVIEDADSKTLRMLGGISFVNPEYIKEARASCTTLHNFVFDAALRGKTAFFSPKQVAIENAQGTLNLMNFLGHFNVTNLSESELSNFYSVNNEAYRFFHFGYNYRVMWFEVFEPHRKAELQTQGMHVAKQTTLADGDIATLFRLTAEDALADPYRRFCTLFFPPKPCFQFSSGEQMLLEYALMDCSDAEASARLHLSMDAVKKRWRSIYHKVDMVAPEVLVEVESGSARRRSLLHYLKHHLEELRPYRTTQRGNEPHL
jgi:hypothetical protein